MPPGHQRPQGPLQGHRHDNGDDELTDAVGRNHHTHCGFDRRPYLAVDSAHGAAPGHQPHHQDGIGPVSYTHLQSGLINGYIGAVERLVRKMSQEMGEEHVQVVATGGMARMMAEGSPSVIDHIDPYLAMDGLKIIYHRNLSE